MEWRARATKRRPVGFVEPCIPTLAPRPPVGPQWIHEIKHDGYRLIVCRRDGRTRLFTRRGYDWTDRYPLIREAMEALPGDATIDGEAVALDAAGVADFERLHSRKHDRQVILFAFDLLEIDGSCGACSPDWCDASPRSRPRHQCGSYEGKGAAGWGGGGIERDHTHCNPMEKCR